MADLHGPCDMRFEAVRSALARNLDSGDELGASLVVDVDGDIVVDLWGGFCALIAERAGRPATEVAVQLPRSTRHPARRSHLTK